MVLSSSSSWGESWPFLALVQHIAHHVFILGLVRGVRLPALGLHLRQQQYLATTAK